MFLSDTYCIPKCITLQYIAIYNACICCQVALQAIFGNMFLKCDVFKQAVWCSLMRFHVSRDAALVGSCLCRHLAVMQLMLSHCYGILSVYCVTARLTVRVIQTVSHPVCYSEHFRGNKKIALFLKNRKEKSFRMSELVFLSFTRKCCVHMHVIAKVWQRDSRNVKTINEALRCERLHAVHPPETIERHMLHSKGKKAELLDVRFSFNAGSLTGAWSHDWFQKHSWEVSVQLLLTLIYGSIKTRSLRSRFMKLHLQTLVWFGLYPCLFALLKWEFSFTRGTFSYETVSNS